MIMLLFKQHIELTGTINVEQAQIAYEAWQYLISERLKPYIENNCDLEPYKKCMAFK